MKKLIALILVAIVGVFAYKYIFAESEEIGFEKETRHITCSRCKGAGVCQYCDGDGYRNGRSCASCDGSKKCSSCLGNGIKMVYIFDGKDYTECSLCHKSGKCRICDGKGIKDYGSMFDKRIVDKCTYCKGNGVCTSCKGEGYTRLSSF